MPNHSSAKKRTRQLEKRRNHNKSYLSNVKTAIKNYRQKIQDSKSDKSIVPEALAESFKKVQSLVQKAAAKGLLHKNNASRKISSLQKSL